MAWCTKGIYRVRCYADPQTGVPICICQQWDADLEKWLPVDCGDTDPIGSGGVFDISQCVAAQVDPPEDDACSGLSGVEKKICNCCKKFGGTWG